MRPRSEDEASPPATPPESPVARYYRRHARFYDPTRWLFLHGRGRAVRALRLEPGSRVLEIGCGTGANFPAILTRLDPRTGSLTGVDFSPEMLRRAARRLPAGQAPVEVIQGDALHAPLAGTFDRILFAYSLSLMPDPRAALDRCLRHLAPGGRVTVVDFDDFRGWGFFSGLIRAWLRRHRVRPVRAPVEGMRESLEDFELESFLGGHYFLASGRSPLTHPRRGESAGPDSPPAPPSPEALPRAPRSGAGD